MLKQFNDTLKPKEKAPEAVKPTTSAPTTSSDLPPLGRQTGVIRTVPIT
jgi:hypothetical protein